MAYLLDSDIVIPVQANDAATIQLVESLVAGGISISMVTYMEVWQGVLESADPTAARIALDRFLVLVPVHPFSHAVARRCAELRGQLKAQGKRVRPRAPDLITAATAIEHGLTLVTRNTRDYQDIPGLTLY
ncbi:MAG TPA: type II toxin-antitoxin system VapC family toxin [Thermomicrobiales bacterium]